MHDISDEYEIRLPTAELAAIEHLKKSPYTHNGRIFVATLAALFLVGFSVFLLVTRT